MRKRFSERMGLQEERQSLQLNSIDDRLRNRIWNKIQKHFFDNIDVSSDGLIEPTKIIRGFGSRNIVEIQGDTLCQILNDEDNNFFMKIYDIYFGIDTKPAIFLDTIVNDLRKRYQIFSWSEIYDYIELLPEIYYDKNINLNFRIAINQLLEEEMSGYRFVDNCIVPIIDDIEIQEIEEVLNSEYTPVKRHLVKALEHLSDRENPDYVNSIKESITAVESVAKIITGKETDLAKCLKVMDLDLNKQFTTAMTNMYGWTCKEDGIRHGHTGEELKTSFEEAKYMLVTCSAFVNYLIAKKG